MRICGKLLFLAIAFSLHFFATAIASPKAFHTDSTFSRARVQEVLDTGGKAVVSTATGFLGFRLAMLGVKKTIEVAAAAIIAALVVRITGILDDIPVSSERSYKFFKLRQDFANNIKEYVQEMQRHVAEREFEDKIKSFFRKERIAAYGFAIGVVGAVLL